MIFIETEYAYYLVHLIFLLLTFGAFYWEFRAFALRAGFWTTVTIVTELVRVLTGEAHTEEVIEVFFLTAILILVFIIARRRMRAEEALREANEALENRVAARTAELTGVNVELIREITQHKQTGETLQESEERYRHLVELSFEAIAIYSEDKFVYLNPPGAKLFGAAGPEELIGKSILDFFYPDYSDITQLQLRQLGEGGKGVPLVEKKLTRLDGTNVDVEVVAIPITYQSRPAVQMVIRDLTARKRAETERERERAHIARDLHDSLGQSLGYLRFKLDEFTINDILSDNDGFRQELAQMRDVTNEAYELVRSMLAAARLSNSTDLATALLAQARSVGNRVCFKVQLTAEGQPRSLSPIVQQQVLYLFQEALNNVEKHARARQVDINLAWTQETLTIIFADDGCGFETSYPPPDGHFGLKIMQERAEEIKGDLSIVSKPDAGTKLTLRLPLTSISHPSSAV